MAAKFVPQIKKLMLKKSVELGYPLTQRELADEAGVSLPTVSRWYNGDFDRIDAETVVRLMGYFQCTFSELIEIVP